MKLRRRFLAPLLVASPVAAYLAAYRGIWLPFWMLVAYMAGGITEALFQRAQKHGNTEGETP